MGVRVAFRSGGLAARGAWVLLLILASGCARERPVVVTERLAKMVCSPREPWESCLARCRSVGGAGEGQRPEIAEITTELYADMLKYTKERSPALLERYDLPTADEVEGIQALDEKPITWSVSRRFIDDVLDLSRLENPRLYDAIVAALKAGRRVTAKPASEEASAQHHGS